MIPEWEPLYAWLASDLPRDVPMPSLVGSKRPMFCHAQRSRPWTWDDAHIFRESTSPAPPITYDIGILLKDLCVIDIDSHELCDIYEARFAELKQAPCEQTAKGRHYYFRRSARADKHGFYDGRAQVEHGVDFKTICHNGTSGFIVVAPSRGKAWLRRPWDEAAVSEIPHALLEAVSRPHHMPVSATCAFPDGSRLEVRDTIWLPRFAYLAPFFEGGDDDDDDDDLATTTSTIPFGVGTAALLHELLALCDSQRLSTWPMPLPALRQLADYLGVPAGIECVLSPWHPSSICARTEALDRISPLMAEASVATGLLLDVEQASLVFEPLLGRDEQWLFHGRDAARPLGGSGGSVLRPDPLRFASAALPAPVLALLMAHANLLLAGGAALGVASDCVGAGSDYDLFVWGLSEAEAEAIKQELVSMPGVTVCAQTASALSVVWGETDEVIQLITWLYQAPCHVLGSFDLAPCKVALGRFGGSSLRLKAHVAWFVSMRHLTCWVDLDCWSEASVARILKYYAKGFDVIVPGLDRASLRAGNPCTFQARRGICNLFKIEAYAVHEAGHGRPSYAQLHALLRRHCGMFYRHSAYEELIPSNLVAHVLGLGASAGRRRSASWRTVLPGRASLFPSSPRCEEAFDLAAMRQQRRRAAS
ncbi:hypothetical protein COO60DRAFT_1643816 [Scenedesmus sp. NREL 46B-D3]|nr:hypothetical protein COO60DRAFT_1643816 [Scenedesmus sp. NREL 46B-D3]